MNDQAQALRNLVQTQETAGGGRTTRILTVTSGKGGVGKSNFSLNFALTLQRLGKRVLVFDADIGMANIDVLMGASTPYNLYHLLKREKSIWDIIHVGPLGIHFIAGGSGFKDLIDLSDAELDYFGDQIGKLHGHYDLILFDTGAGLSKETVKFIVAAQETVVVTTPEPTSITDAYALIKMVKAMNHDVDFKLVVNRAIDGREGKQTADKIGLVARQFLQMELPLLGVVMDDANVTKAVKRQVPFTLAYPGGDAAKSIEDIAKRFLAVDTGGEKGGVRGFLQRMFRR
ncbi:cobyrinic acid a,c-diamide synthase [Paenibacillus darwinianus]|uniref:Cobyrinic acid a,c-diamide synthase n=1 Tax=Paenibacillus darwinianus TaxID=1380763 RepID=A0A9W5W8H9_9BACL|nr:MinD/ParA family protein [Paenibacillus darwinianus]EXX91305.1 cobyrinic acid a,c-diamide synthase [Paenibacillus darwinianus]EXX92250.1 cobyrinic acid a,c-diamide synthase [Paenibacillus darwinianus]EXX92825.1 cobyrinic acid a,c-diamide synthase [Paenibacillus darwinianus]